MLRTTLTRSIFSKTATKGIDKLIDLTRLTCQMKRVLCFVIVYSLYCALAYRNGGVSGVSVRVNRLVTRARGEASTGLLRPMRDYRGATGRNSRLHMSTPGGDPQNPMVSTDISGYSALSDITLKPTSAVWECCFCVLYDCEFC